MPKRIRQLSARWMQVVAMSMLVLALAGCRTAPFPAERVPRLQWLVLPLSQPPAMSETPRAIQGWWFGARTIRQNPQAGQQVADMLSRRLASLGYVNLYSPFDLRYYFEAKRTALMEAYPHLEPAEVTNLLAEVPRVRYGQELGADRILSGRIHSLYMAENRTIHWWWSVADIELQVIDVATGDVLWTRRYRERGHFDSQTTVIEEILDQFVSDFQQEVLLPMTLSEAVTPVATTARQ